MRIRNTTVMLAVAFLPQLAAAQASPIADAFRGVTAEEARNIIAAAELMPADKYSYRPTPAQMSFAMVVEHLSEGNDDLCGLIAGKKAPARTPVDTTAGKAALVARLKDTFSFCTTALATLDDSKLGEQLPWFGSGTRSRGVAILSTTLDWGDHYSQAAIYLRLNGVLPPTARPHTGGT
jgi:hypothetical protein